MYLCTILVFVLLDGVSQYLDHCVDNVLARLCDLDKVFSQLLLIALENVLNILEHVQHVSEGSSSLRLGLGHVHGQNDGPGFLNAEDGFVKTQQRVLL